MIHIACCPLGVFAYDAKGNAKGHVLFPNGKEAEAIHSCMQRTLSREEKELVSKLGKDKIVFESKKEGYEHEFPNLAGEFIRKNMEKLAFETGKCKSKQEFLILMRNAAYDATARKMRSSDVNDRLIVQAVNTIDDIDNTLNLLAVRLREWYGFYFPEISEKVDSHEQFVKYVSETLYRSDARGIDVSASIGSEIGKDDLEHIRSYAKSILALYEERKDLERYIDKKTKEVVPNIHAIVGGTLAARLLSSTGSLEKLAKFPSSTIQILGAEKALFRFLCGQGTSPKHGIIFTSKYIQQAPLDRRGKMARILASKISVASRIDKFNGEFAGDALRQDVESALEQMMSDKKKPSKKPAAKKDDYSKFSKRPEKHKKKGKRR